MDGLRLFRLNVAGRRVLLKPNLVEDLPGPGKHRTRTSSELPPVVSFVWAPPGSLSVKVRAINATPSS